MRTYKEVTDAPGGTKIGVDTATIDGGPVSVALSENFARIREAIVTPTLDLGEYDAGDNVGGLLEFPNMVAEAGDWGELLGFQIARTVGSEATTDPPSVALWLFDDDGEAPTDQAVWNPSDANNVNSVQAILYLGSSGGGAQYQTPQKSNIQFSPLYIQRYFKCEGTSLFGVLVAMSAVTFDAADELAIRLVTRTLASA